jgi:hypothetical protein
MTHAVPWALLVFGTASCAASSKTPDAPESTATETTLTVTSPEADLPVSLSGTHPGTLRLRVVRVVNPSNQGVSIAVALRRDGAEQVIGTVALYPADQPGTFLLSLPPPVADLLGRPDGAPRLHLRLQSSVVDRPLVEPLKVVVTAPVWR